MAMTEWQDVGMNSEEKAQLQAIYDAVVINPNIYVVSEPTKSNDKSSFQVTVPYDITNGFMIVSKSKRDATSYVSSISGGSGTADKIIEDNVTYTSSITCATILEVYHIKNYKENDILTISQELSASTMVYFLKFS